MFLVHRRPTYSIPSGQEYVLLVGFLRRKLKLVLLECDAILYHYCTYMYYLNLNARCVSVVCSNLQLRQIITADKNT